MARFVPKDKLSKKAQKELNRQRRTIPADMAAFSSGRRYSLAIIARSGFMHLPTQDLQIKALKNLREQLLPGGILTLNTFDPWPPIQAQQMQLMMHLTLVEMMQEISQMQAMTLMHL